jgi:S-adenosylmethionine decarboxylase proenzyme
MKALGRHILVEVYGCDPQTLNNCDSIQEAMIQAAERSGATICGHSFHEFSPHGVSGVVVIAESHLSIHTWPEYRFAALDLFTCGDDVDPWVAFDHLRKAFKATHSSQIEIRRGQFPFDGDRIRPHKPDQ